MKTCNCRFFLRLAAIVGVVYTSVAAGQTTYTESWRGGPGGWNGAPSNWNGNAAQPNNTSFAIYNVSIASGANDSVLLNDSPVINSLVLGTGSNGTAILYDLSASGAQTLTVNGPVTVNSNGTINFSYSTLNAGSLANYGNITLQNSAGTSVSGNFQNYNRLTIQNSALAGVTGTFSNTGSVVDNGIVSAAALANSGNLSIGSGATLTLTSGISSIDAGSTISNLGTVNSGASVSNQSTFAGLNTIAGTLYVNGQTNNITPGTGILNLTGEMDIIGSGTLMNVAGQLGLSGNASLTLGSGATLTASQGITDIPDNTYLGIGGTFTAQGVNALSALNSIEGELDLYNATSNNIQAGSGTLNNSGSLLIYQPGTQVNINNPVVNSNSLYAYLGSNVQIAGALTNTNNSQMLVYSNATLTASSIANEGQTLIYVGGMVTTPSFTNDGSTYVYQQNSVLSAGAFSNTNYAAVYNGGAITSTNISNTGYLSMYNAGSVTSSTFTNADSATVWVGGSPDGIPSLFHTTSLINEGAISADPGGQVQVGSNLPNRPGYYQNGSLTEVISGEALGPGSLCTGSGDCGIISVSDGAYLSGSFYVNLLNGFLPNDGDSFIILTFAGDDMGPGFDFENPTFNNGTQYFAITYGDGFVELTAESIPEPATLLYMGGGLVCFALLSRRRGTK